MIIKASCQIHGIKVKEDKHIYHRMVVDSDKFEIHANDEPNLNLDAGLFNKFNLTVPNYRPQSSIFSKIERILPKHLDLINFWLAPHTYNVPPPLDYYLEK